MIPGRALLVAGVVLLATPTFGQYASESARREALQHYRAGLEFLSSEQFEKAADAFRKTIEKDRLLALAHYGLGQSYMALKRYASALVAYRNCRETYEELVGRALSENVTAERQRDDEIRDLRDSIRLFQSSTVKTASPDRTQYIVKLETRLRELERMKQTNIVPQKPPAFVSLALGSAYFRHGQLEDAEREWKVALATDPHFGEAHNNLAALYAMTGRIREAQEAVRAAEGAGFPVHPQLKDDIRRATAR
ncbi:MAG: tetratricopeptide repeat protein [Acidobacteria bacterium]|nr:tetratricopeptide repeat protein [Acidobacteriota bacterium]